MQSNSPVVLIVDDHQDSVAMYAFGLLAMGFQPVTADTAAEGFGRACACQPDAIVVDVTLPGGSGLDLTRRLRQDARTKDAAIIVLTGHTNASTQREASDAGCDRFLIKPCMPDALAVEIRDALLMKSRRTLVEDPERGDTAGSHDERRRA